MTQSHITSDILRHSAKHLRFRSPYRNVGCKVSKSNNCQEYVRALSLCIVNGEVLVDSILYLAEAVDSLAISEKVATTIPSHDRYDSRAPIMPSRELGSRQGLKAEGTGDAVFFYLAFTLMVIRS